MGTWLYGNFDSDGAMDYIGGVIDDFSDKIDAIFDDEDAADLDEAGESELVPNVEIIYQLCDKRKGAPPKCELIEKWKSEYLEIFDEQIEDLAPQGDYAANRRKVVVDTFDRLLAIAYSFHKKK